MKIQYFFNGQIVSARCDRLPQPAASVVWL